MTIGKFVEKVKEDLIKEFNELRSVNSDDLLYIKEDLILPHVRFQIFFYSFFFF